MGEKLYHWSVLLTKLVYLNILWLLFTLLGGLVLGVMPATTALFAVLRRLLMGEVASLKVGPCFTQYYFKEFFKTNGCGLVLLALGALLYVNYQVTLGATSYLLLALHYGTIGLGLVLVVLLVFFFPVYVHFQLPLTKLILQPLLLIFFSPFEVAKVLVILIGSYYLFHWIPGLLPLSYMSLPASLIMFVMYQRFLKLPTGETPSNAILH